MSGRVAVVAGATGLVGSYLWPMLVLGAYSRPVCGPGHVPGGPGLQYPGRETTGASPASPERDYVRRHGTSL